MAGRVSHCIFAQYPNKLPRLEIRGINSGEQAIALARELHHTRPTARIEVLRVQKIATIERTRRQ